MKLRSLLIAFFLLTTISLQSASAATSSTVGGGCSTTIKRQVLATVTGQTKVLGRKDFATAMAYSTAQFRSNVSVKDFTAIIDQSYNFLENTASFQIVECQIMGKSIHLGVRLVDTSSSVHYLVYVLQPQSKKEVIAPNKTGYGIAAAALGKIAQESF